MTRDARIPVRFVRHAPPVAQADQVLLLPEQAAGQGVGQAADEGWITVLRLPSQTVSHQPFCRCCAGRPAQASTLTWLFQARARGEVGFFHGLVAHLPPPQEAALRALLASDLFLSGRFVQAN